ncbi:MAG: class I SAM-dependent methyltransferase [Gammaproteobacteria bacterium]|nr:class I SAM-dependent methyltransferase [Gammaproteobacteria bacterium]
MPRYDRPFFDYVSEGAQRSARALLPLVAELKVTSVLDVGCGHGAWLAVWRERGVDDVVGIDGGHVDTQHLRIPSERFVVRDLRHEFSLDRRFDLAQCFEVAEHLPPGSAEGLVRSLTRHADLVLFSAAPKGQGGEHHINEQSYDYWRMLFAGHDFVAVDGLRNAMHANTSVEPWYRYNTFLYVARRKTGDLPAAFAHSIVPDQVPLRDISPTAYRLRKLIIGCLPVWLVSALSRIKVRSKSRHWQANR